MAQDLVKTIVTAREDTINTTTIAQTPGLKPDVAVIAVPSWRIVLVRVLRVYLQSFSGFLTALMSGAMAAAAAKASGMTSADVSAVLPHEFGGIVFLAASMAVAPCFMTLLQNALELLTRLDESHPQLRG